MPTDTSIHQIFQKLSRVQPFEDTFVCPGDFTEDKMALHEALEFFNRALNSYKRNYKNAVKKQNQANRLPNSAIKLFNGALNKSVLAKFIQEAEVTSPSEDKTIAALELTYEKIKHLKRNLAKTPQLQNSPNPENIPLPVEMREKLPEIPQHKKTSSINWSYVLTAATLAAGSACLIAGSLVAPATQPYWFCMGALLIARGLFSLLKMAAGFAMRTYMQHRFFNASKETEGDDESDFTPQHSV